MRSPARSATRTSSRRTAPGWWSGHACSAERRSRVRRVTGLDVCDLLAEGCARRAAPLFLLGGRNGVAAAAATNSEVRRFPELVIAGTWEAGTSRDRRTTGRHLSRSRRAGLGRCSSPTAHRVRCVWIARNREALVGPAWGRRRGRRRVRLLAGRVPRAPGVVRRARVGVALSVGAGTVAVAAAARVAAVCRAGAGRRCRGALAASAALRRMLIRRWWWRAAGGPRSTGRRRREGSGVADDRFDAIVVGAGPAGITAARRLARGGLALVVLERGQFPGAKNVWGGILYREPTEAMAPGFEEEAPLERPIIEQRYLLLTDDAMMGATYRSQRFAEPPFNAYSRPALPLRSLVRRRRPRRPGPRSTPSSPSSICSGRTARSSASPPATRTASCWRAASSSPTARTRCWRRRSGCTGSGRRSSRRWWPRS